MSMLILLFSIKNYSQLTNNNTFIKGKLKNNLTYFIKQNNYPHQQTLCYLVVKTGAIHETHNQLGYAHFLEHIAFKGGKRFTKKPFTQYLKEQGLEIGTHYNAHTHYEYTIYTFDFPNPITTPTLKYTLNFFADILDSLHIRTKDIKSEKRIVLAEKQISPASTPHFIHKIGNSLYKKRTPIIGTNKNINNITQKKLLSFCHKWYQPKNAAIFIVGNIEKPKKVLEIINKQLTPIRNKNNITHSKYSLFKSLKPTIKKHYDKEEHSSKLFLEWATPYKGANDTPTKHSSNKVFRKIITNRINRLLKKDINYLNISNDHFLSDVAYTSFSCNTHTNINKVIKTILQEVKRIALHGVSPNEFSFYSKKELTNTSKKQQTSSMYMNTYINSFLQEKPLFSHEKNKVKNITPKSIQKEAIELWKSNKIRVFISSPTKLKEQNTVIKKILAKVASTPLSPLSFQIPKITEKENKTHTPNLYVKKQKPINPIYTKYYENLGIHELKYKNGVDVFIKPIKNESNEIRVLGFAKGGTSNIPDSLYYQYESTVGYLNLGGISNLNTKELETFLDDKTMGITVNISEYTRNIHAYTHTKHTNDFFKYLFLKMTDSKKDSIAFNQVIKEEIASLKHKKKTPVLTNTSSKIIATLQNSYFPNRKIASKEHDYNKLNLAQMHAFYNKAFNNGNGWQFIITGNLTLKNIMPLLNTYLGNLPYNSNTIKNKLLFNLNNHPTKRTININGHSNSTKQYFIYYGNYKPNLKNALLASLTEKILANDIRNTLREKYGIVYTPSVSITKHIQPSPFLTIQISYSCNPKETLHAQKLVEETISKLINQPITSQKLNNYKKRILLQYNAIINSNNSYTWGFSLLKSLSENETIEELNNYTSTLENISTNELQSFIRNILQPNKVKILTVN